MDMTFKGLSLGDDSNYVITSIDGWEDRPETTNGSTPYPRRLGSWVGGLSATKRVVTVDLEILGDTSSYLTTTPKRALARALAMDDVESPLVLDLGYGIAPEQIFARVTAFSMPTVKGYGQRQSASIEFTATDPRRYSLNYNSAVTGLPTPIRGVEYPIQYGKYTAVLTPSNRGEAVLQNLGNAEAPAIYRITGPSPQPSITVTNGGHVRRTYFNLPLAPGEVLQIDTGAGLVTVNGAVRNGITAGALVEDLGLPAGQCAVALGGAGSAQTSLSVMWRDANL